MQLTARTTARKLLTACNVKIVVDIGLFRGIVASIRRRRLNAMMFLYSDSFEEKPWVKDTTTMTAVELADYIDKGMFNVAEANGVEIFLEYCDIY